jgi:hypothetical protein
MGHSVRQDVKNCVLRRDMGDRPGDFFGSSVSIRGEDWSAGIYTGVASGSSILILSVSMCCGSVIMSLLVPTAPRM